MKKSLRIAALAVLFTAGATRVGAMGGPNQCPTAIGQSVSTPQGIPLDIDLQGNDPNGDQLFFGLVGGPTHGTLTFGGTLGECAYSPAAGYCGPDSFTFNVTDGICTSAPDTVTIDVVCVPQNRCPTADSFTINVDQDSTVAFDLRGDDSDNDPTQYAITQPPAHGTLVVSLGTGSASYTPNAGYCGPDVLKYTVSDGLCTSSAATVAIVVACLPQNRCPTADSASVNVEQGASVTFQLSGSDSDGDPISYGVKQAPAHGIIVLNLNTGAVTYTPNAGYCGPDMFAYTVDDGICESDPGVISINVGCVTPVAIDIKPGGSPNSFKCGSNGVVSVAILGSPTFNATTINKATVKLETTGGLITAQGSGTKIKDVNGDGRLDLTVQFSSPAISAGIGCPLPVNTILQLKVRGTTLSGVNFAGVDSIRVVGP